MGLSEALISGVIGAFGAVLGGVIAAITSAYFTKRVESFATLRLLYGAILILLEYVSIKAKELEIEYDYPDPDDPVSDFILGAENPFAGEERRLFNALHILTKYEYFLPQYKAAFVSIEDNIRSVRLYKNVDDSEYSKVLVQLRNDLNTLKNDIGKALSKYFKTNLA